MKKTIMVMSFLFSLNAFAESSYVIMKVSGVDPFGDNPSLTQAYELATNEAKEECKNNGGVLEKTAKIKHYDAIVAGICVLK